jgi:hypothetical protein
LTTAEFGMPATAHAIGNEGSFVLCYGPPNLEQQLIVRIVTHRAFQEFDLTPALGEFIDQ